MTNVISSGYYQAEVFQRGNQSWLQPLEGTPCWVWLCINYRIIQANLSNLLSDVCYIEIIIIIKMSLMSFIAICHQLDINRNCGALTYTLFESKMQTHIIKSVVYEGYVYIFVYMYTYLFI